MTIFHCSYCNQTKTRKPSEISKSGLNFCSRECFKQAVKEKLVHTGRRLSNTATKEAGRGRARRWFKSRPCEICKKIKSQRHHIDGNPLNNQPENIAMLCAKHHVYADRLDILRKVSRQGGFASIKDAVRDESGRFIARTRVGWHKKGNRWQLKERCL